MPEPSWRTVAYMLADRLENNDFCHDHSAIEDGLAEGCPFCQDREAMRVFRSKSGTRPTDIEGTLVPVHEIRVTGSTDPES